MWLLLITESGTHVLDNVYENRQVCNNVQKS